MKAVVLLSGGLDSCVAAAIAVDQYGSSQVAGVSFDYGQRHSLELISARKVSEALGINTWRVVELRNVWRDSKATLLHDDADIPRVNYSEIEGLSPVFVPGRNTVFISAASPYALELEASQIFIGAHASDYDRYAYPDCSPSFVRSMHFALWHGSGRRLELVAPLLKYTKVEVVRIGLDLKAPLHLTYSCYTGHARPCGTCPTCRERARAFAVHGLADPAEEVNT